VDILYLEQYSASLEVIPDTSSSTDPPDEEVTAYRTGSSPEVTAFLDYTGSVSEGSVRLWLHDGADWYKGDSYSLTSSNGDVSLMWDVGKYQVFTFQIEDISGGGTVRVSVKGS